MKKIISIAAILSLVLSCCGALSVHAAEEPTIYYSVDRTKWYEMPITNFTGNAEIKFAADLGTQTAKVYIENGDEGLIIPEKTQFLYLYAEVPDGAKCDFYATIDTARDQEPWKDLVDGGEWAWNSESGYAARPVKISDSVNKADGPKTAVSVPLRLGRIDVYAYYTEGTFNSLYKVSVKGGWTVAAHNPRMANLHGDFRVYTGVAAGYPILMNGASLANDNQTYLFSYCKWRINGNERRTWDEANMWVGAHFSKWLEGSSYVMMPGSGMAENYKTYNDVDDKFFDLTTESNFSWQGKDGILEDEYGNDYIGEVVVLMTDRADSKSAYYTDPAWECVNSGSTPIGGGDALKNKPRNYNDYTDNAAGDSKYYGVAIQWRNNSGYREMSPAISGELTSAHYSDFVELNFAYRRKFKAEETIEIFSPANLSDSERGCIIVPIIKYYLPTETADIKDVQAKYLASGDGVPAGGAVAVNVTTLIGNYTYGRKIMATYALYDENGALADVAAKVQEASTTSDEFIFACGAGKAKFLNVMFVNDENTLIATKKVAINP